MWNRVLLAAAFATVPSAALASNVFVDVHTVNRHSQVRTIVEFRPEHGAYVALYGHFSDGEVRPLFPTSDCSSHWVDGYELRVIEVDASCGPRLEDVQVITSSHWFDPTECWIAWAPQHRDVVVYTACDYPTRAWRFSLAWGPSRSVRVARSWCWEPERVWWRYEGGRRYVARHAPYPKHDVRPHQSHYESHVKFKDSDRNPHRVEKKVVASTTKTRDGRESARVESRGREKDRGDDRVARAETGRSTKGSTKTKEKSSSAGRKGSGEPGR